MAPERSVTDQPLHIHSFPPIERSDSSVLLLGSMPGKVSLREKQYYAHPRNLFWKILGEVLGFDSAVSYERRVGFLKSAGVAVWDVLQTCTRDSSLDSDIDDTTAIPNDFASFYANHPRMRRVCFNGAKAEALYGKLVRPRLAQSQSDLVWVRLPSTSPANAAIPFTERLRAWTAGIQPLLLLAVVLVGCGPTVAESGPAVTSARDTGATEIAYSCESGRTITASYPSDTPAVVEYEGQTRRMTQAVSASGVRYVGGEWSGGRRGADRTPR